MDVRLREEELCQLPGKTEMSHLEQLIFLRHETLPESS